MMRMRLIQARIMTQERAFNMRSIQGMPPLMEPCTASMAIQNIQRTQSIKEATMPKGDRRLMSRV